MGMLSHSTLRTLFVALVAVARACGYYRIPAANLARVQRLVARLANRANRLACAPVSLEVVRSETEVTHKRLVREYVIVRLSADVVRLDGWRFAAVLDHLYGTEAGTIIRAVPGVELAGDYRHADGSCSHCNLPRGRLNTYVVQHEDGREAVVGSSCLKDFLGHDPHAALRSAEYLIEAVAICEDGEELGSGRHEDRVLVERFVAYASLAMRENGWVSRTKARENFDLVATADIAVARMWPGLGQPQVEPEAQDVERAEAAVAWATQISDEDTERNDYLHNLRVVCRAGVINHKGFGIAASVLAAYDRAQQKELERKARRASALNEHFGAVDTYTVRRLTVTRIIPIEGYYATSYLHLMRDDEGRAAKWFASRDDVLEVGEPCFVGGTVKALDHHEGLAQTQLTRCHRAEDPNVVAPALTGLTAAQAKRLHAHCKGTAAKKSARVDAKLVELGLLVAGEAALTAKGAELLRTAGVTCD